MLDRMFLRYFLELDAPVDVVERALLRAPESWIPGLATGASSQVQRLLVEVGFGEAHRAEKLVILEIGEPIHVASKVILPLRWKPAGESGLLPTLDADIELAPLGPAKSQLAMMARYTPPFGLLGEMADRALLHRVAEATIKDFVERIAEGLRPRLAATRVRPAS
jgi:hypothetical protein